MTTRRDVYKRGVTGYKRSGLPEERGTRGEDYNRRGLQEGTDCNGSGLQEGTDCKGSGLQEERATRGNGLQGQRTTRGEDYKRRGLQ